VLDAFVTLPVDTPVADVAAQLRRQHRWNPPDALQAAIALHHGLFFVTRNTKDFPPARFPLIEAPYKV
jgi:predicted nucleic acid-binding protein